MRRYAEHKIPMPKVKVTVRSEVKIVSQQYLKNNESNLTKLHRKIGHTEKVCRAQHSGSYAQAQGHNQVRGEIAPKIRSE